MRGGRGRQLGVGALGNGRGFVQKWLRAFFCKRTTATRPRAKEPPCSEFSRAYITEWVLNNPNNLMQSYPT
jgi:hypothetical protein